MKIAAAIDSRATYTQRMSRVGSRKIVRESEAGFIWSKCKAFLSQSARTKHIGLSWHYATPLLWMDDPHASELRMGLDDGLELSPTKAIPRSELSYRASRAGGAGGQHVNTSSTRIELLWNVRTTGALDDDERARVTEKLASRIDKEGWIRVVSSSRRSQGQNRDAAEARLVELVKGALVVQRKRKPTRPTRGAKEARLTEKKKRGDTKRQRRPESFD
ncbi:MAG: alternative ribosome rescue aminoacyl-tRNA hydrolase ArfB [bacterium]